MRDSHERIATGKLTPASPDAGDEARAYAPRVPWKWIAVAFVVVGGFWGVMELRDRREAGLLRDGITGSLDGQLAPAVHKYQDFRKRVEGWTMEAARENPPKTFVDPRLRISSLYKAEGAYLRVRTEDGASAEGIEKAAKGFVPDAIGRCLGVAPAALKGFYDQGGFLMQPWRDAVSKETSVARLRVLESDLKLRVARDLPNLLSVTNASYFLLAVQRGDNRHSHPVDVFLWDTRSGARLLATRTQSTGTLLSVRIAGQPRGARPPSESAGIYDCSIASQVKELAGEPAMEVDNPTAGAQPADGAKAPEAAPAAAPAPSTPAANTAPAPTAAP